jgi:fluoride exporter
VNPGDTEQAVDGKGLANPGSAAAPGPAGSGDPLLPLDPDVDLDARSVAGGPGQGRDRPNPPWRVLGAIAVGGFAGGTARYELGLAVAAHRGTFPVATFGINISGSFVLALLLVYVLEIWPPTTYVRPLLGVGFCGAYTTFSTWMVGVDQLLSDGRAATAAGYLFGSLVAGLAATSLGLTVGRAVVAHRRRVGETGRGRS